MICSRTRAEVGLLTKPLASSLHCFLKHRVFCLLKRHLFCSSLSEHKHCLKFQVIDLELILHVVD